MSLRINGLGQKEIKMLNTMWEFQELEDLEAWQQTLRPGDYRLSKQLMNMVLIESLDQHMAKETKFPDAKKVLSKYMLNSSGL